MATAFDGVCAIGPQAGAAEAKTVGDFQWPSFRAEWDVCSSSDSGWPIALACAFVAGSWPPAGPAGGPSRRRIGLRPVDPLTGIA